MAQTSIRPYRAEDRDAVRRIAVGTALLGDSVVGQYRDFDSMADALSAYYTDREPENALVAVRDGRVVGYMLSCLDTRRVVAPSRYALRHIFLRGVCFRPGTARFYLRAVRDTLLDLGQPGRPELDLDHYPSHTHCNFAADARGSGVGKQIYFQLFDQLKARGAQGVHGEVMTENVRMLTWAESKLGYQLHGQPYPVPGLRNADGKRLYLQMIKRDLRNWQPGAWQANE